MRPNDILLKSHDQLSNVLTNFSFLKVHKVAIAIKTSLIGTVYAKSMKAKPVSLASYSTGEITNFMSTDVNRVVNFCPSFHQFWSLPFQVIVTLVLLYYQVFSIASQYSIIIM